MRFFYCKEKDCKKQLSIIYRKVISLQSLFFLLSLLVTHQYMDKRIKYFYNESIDKKVRDNNE